MASTQLRSSLRKICPPWIQPKPQGGGKDQGFKFLYTFGLVADASTEAMLQGELAKMPGSTGTSIDYARLSRDRRIRRGFAETDAAFEKRLQRWRDDWKRAGNPYALMRQLQGYCHPTVPLCRVFNNAGTCYTLNTDSGAQEKAASAWAWDAYAGASSHQSRIWVVLYSLSGAPWSESETYGDGSTWGGGQTWGSTLTADQVADLRNIVNDWKAGHEVCVSVIVCFDASLFDPATPASLPDGTWGLPYKIVGGVAVPSRAQGAIYLDGIA